MAKIYEEALEGSMLFPGVLLDAYGVFWAGDALGPFLGAKKQMELLVSSGKTVGILSNTTKLANEEIIKLASKEIYQGIHFHFFISSGEITRKLFLEKRLPFATPRNTFYLLGEPHPTLCPENTLFANTAYRETQTIEEADFLYSRVPHIGGEDQTDPALFLDTVSHLSVKPPLICANPDLFTQQGNPPRMVVRQGSIAAMYQKVGGIVHYTGKPDPLAYFQAMEEFKKMGIEKKENVLMIGDNPSTDILGAKNFGIPSALILSRGVMGERVRFLGIDQAIASLTKEESPDLFLRSF